MDIRQSEEYAKFMQRLGWKVEKTGKYQVFIRKFPFFGSLIKIQRIIPPVPLKEIEIMVQKHRAYKITIEFDQSQNKTISLPNYKINHSPFLPTKTVLIDLNKTEKEIFNSFTPEKRRAVRKAEKNMVIVKQVKDTKEFLWLKKHSLWEKFIFPIGSDKEIKALWQSFSPNHAKILVAFHQNKPVAGIFLLFYQKTAYYWLAAAIKKGKKLSAPSLLVWEALKTAKTENCLTFDFEGIYDERFPLSSWLGFTKFKKGFGGKEVVFPDPLKTSGFFNSKLRKAF